jgi:hypothetical protein
MAEVFHYQYTKLAEEIFIVEASSKASARIVQKHNRYHVVPRNSISFCCFLLENYNLLTRCGNVSEDTCTEPRR